MTDEFQLREDASVAWLAFRREIGHLLTPANEELLHLAYLHAYGAGWIKGCAVAMAKNAEVIDRLCKPHGVE